MINDDHIMRLNMSDTFAEEKTLETKDIMNRCRLEWDYTAILYMSRVILSPMTLHLNDIIRSSVLIHDDLINRLNMSDIFVDLITLQTNVIINRFQHEDDLMRDLKCLV